MANCQSWDLNCLFSGFTTVEISSRFQKTHPFMFWQKPASRNPSKYAVVEYGSGRREPYRRGRIICL